MPAPVKLDAESFIGLVKQSRLVDPDLLKKVWSELKGRQPPVEDPKGIADDLIARNVLTRWQADKLLQRKHKGFFLGKYRLLSHLGSGGMSAVYLAEHVLMRRRVAIKVLPAARVDDSSYLERFHREAQAVAALDHRNIVRAYDVDQEGKVHFLVMEYVAGQSLHDLVLKSGTVGYVEAVEYCRQAAEGLHHAHRMGMVHRDVKPGNLLLDERGTIKLLDLGLARYFDEGEEHSLTIKHDEKVLGTADFLSPEQALDSHKVDIRSDIYSLGCTLYYLLTGHAPFPEGTLAQRLLAHQTKQPQPIRKDRPDIPDALVAILEKMMAKKPEDRYQTTKDAAAAMLQWLTENGGAAWSKMNSGIAGAGGPPSGLAPPGEISGSNVLAVESGPTRKGTSGSDAAASGAGGSSTGTSTTKSSHGPLTVAETAASAAHEPELAAFLSHLAAEHSEPLSSTVRKNAATARETTTPPTTAEPTDDEVVDHFGATIVTPPPDDAAAANMATAAWSPGSGVEPPFSEEAGSPQAAPARTAAPGGPAAASRSPGAPPSSTKPGKKPGTKATAGAPGRKSATDVKQLTPPAATPAVALPPWLMDRRVQIGGGAAVALLLGVIGYLAFGGGGGNAASSATDTSKTATSDVEPGSKKKASDKVVPLRRELTVGAGRTFATIAAALADAKQNVNKGRRATQVIKVAGGQTYAERIVLDAGFPRGIQLVADGSPPPILAPSGSDPIVHLQGGKEGIEGFRLEGFELDARGKPVAVQLSGWTPGATLKRLRIGGFERAGVVFDGSQTFGAEGDKIIVEETTFRDGGSEGVGALFQHEAEDPMHIRIRECRFLGPLAAGIRFDCGAIDIEIQESIFFRTQTGVKLEGGDRAWRDFVLAFDTFYENDHGLAFSQMPGSSSSGFGFFNNLFYGSTSADAVVEQGYSSQAFVAMSRTAPGGASFNWTTRPKPDMPAPGEIDSLFETQSSRFEATDVRFASIDPATGNFLAPAPGSPHRQPGTLQDKRRFGMQIGAVRAK